MNHKSTQESVLASKRVLLVDDHGVVRAGLSALINREPDLETCGEAATEREAIEAVQFRRPDVVVLDWSLGTKDAAELLHFLKANHPHLPVLVFSMHDETFYAERAIKAGARGYLMKQEGSDRILSALRTLLEGQSYLSEKVEWVLKGSGYVHQSSPTNGKGPKIVDLRPLQSLKYEPKIECCFVSIVIPVFNSEASLEALVATLVAELQQTYRLQVILVDDGSTDRSALVCKAIQDRYPDLVDFVALSKNFGEHNAVMAGLCSAEGDYCVIMDDDFQNPPSQVRKLIQEIRLGYDVVYVRYDSKKHSWFRNLGSRFANWSATRALGKPSELYLSSFKALNRFMIHEAANYTGADPHIDALILRTTRKIGVVQARHEYRTRGKSGYTLPKLLSLWSSLLIPFSLYPLRLLALGGTLLTLTGAGFWIYNLVADLSTAIPDATPVDKLHASLWFFRGIHSLSIALVGEYVGRIHRQLNRHPQFIVRDVQRRCMPLTALTPPHCRPVNGSFGKIPDTNSN